MSSFRATRIPENLLTGVRCLIDRIPNLFEKSAHQYRLRRHPQLVVNIGASDCCVAFFLPEYTDTYRSRNE